MAAPRRVSPPFFRPAGGEAAKPAEPPKQEVLLAEIRDLLKQR